MPQPLCRLRRSRFGQRRRLRVGHRCQQQQWCGVVVVVIVFICGGGGGDGSADPRGGGDRLRLVPQHAQHSSVVRLQGWTESLGIIGWTRLNFCSVCRRTQEEGVRKFLGNVAVFSVNRNFRFFGLEVKRHWHVLRCLDAVFLSKVTYLCTG